MMSQGNKKGDLKKFQGCFKEISRMFQGNVKGVLMEGCLEGVKGVIVF